MVSSVIRYSDAGCPSLAAKDCRAISYDMVINSRAAREIDALGGAFSSALGSYRMPSLDFKGKQFVYAHHLSVPFRQLDIDAKKSLVAKGGKPDLDGNLIIHGDNLHALKALLPKYAGEIKAICIDPPYNTGTEGWCYNDNVNSPLMKEWLKDSANPVDKDDLERHDKWLCMMWPRLHLLRELLADNGVVFVNIDNNEQHALRMLMDEVFGEINFVGTFIWRRKEGGGQASDYFVTEHEYVHVYRKSNQFVWIDEELDLSEKDFNKEDSRGKYKAVKLAKWGNTARREDRQSMYFPISSPDGKKCYPIAPDGNDGRWRVGKRRMEEIVENDLIHWEKKDGKWLPYEKIYFVDGDTKVLKERSIVFDLYFTSDGTNALTQIFGKKDVLENPKPYELIRLFLEHTTTENDIILDSFAGSGTTAHAVMALNKEDGGNRKFILVECEDYADTITAERVRRVIKGVPGAKDEALKSGLGGSFTFCELGKEINIDNLLKGGQLPDYDELARYAFYTATGLTLDKVKQGTDYFVGETDQHRVHMIYKPDAAFLRSGESALNAALAVSISKARGKKTALVFATHKFMGQKELTEMGVTYCQLPYAIHRVMGD